MSTRIVSALQTLARAAHRVGRLGDRLAAALDPETTIKGYVSGYADGVEYAVEKLGGTKPRPHHLRVVPPRESS